MDKNLQQMNQKVEVIENKLSDISKNVTPLMWKNQSLSKDIQEQ